MNGVIKEIYCKKNSFMNNFEILHFFFCYYHCVKVFVFGIFLVRIQSECGKIWTR